MSLETVKMKHSYSIGGLRYVDVDEENDVTIRDETNLVKHAFFTATRWVKFVDEIPNNDLAIQSAITLKPTDYNVHVSGNWYVTVTDEMPFVDVCRWYNHSQENTIQPTPVGIALIYSQ